jgi:apolipoprotein N-acyltransferase
LAWLAPIPWVWLIRLNVLPGRRPYLVMTVIGFCFWLAALHWLRLPDPATSIGWIALSFYFAFYLPVFVGLSRVATHRLHIPLILAAPIIWTGLELTRAHLLTGMSMAELGHTQYRWISLIQLSDLAGSFGVSFVVMFVAACLAGVLPCQERGWCVWPLFPAAGLLVAAILYGHYRMENCTTVAGPRIALVQGSVDIAMRYDPERREQILRQYQALSRRAAAKGHKVDLIVWPETMFLTGPEYHDSLLAFAADAAVPARELFDGTEAEFREWLPRAVRGSQSRMAEMARTLDASLLVGVDTRYFGPKAIHVFNAAAFVDPAGRLLGRYDKMHLVMFGEYVPLAQQWPWLQRLTPLPISVTAGERPAVFELGNARIAPNICYESVLSHVIRRQVNTLAAEDKEPDVLVNLTNDGWFWGSSELDMHLACGVFRAVECRKPFLIAANTGLSAWIDSDGRIQQQGPRRAETVILAEPRLDRSRHSWYLAHGDWFGGICLVVCGICGLVGFFGQAGGAPSNQTGRWRTPPAN